MAGTALVLESLLLLALPLALFAHDDERCPPRRCWSSVHEKEAEASSPLVPDAVAAGGGESEAVPEAAATCACTRRCMKRNSASRVIV